MSMLRLSFTLLSVFALGGCAIATPFQGPGYDRRNGVAIESGDRLVVAMTKAVLKQDRTLRPTFWAYVSKVEASLATRPGFVGYALRREVFGRQAWTMTVWSDEASLAAFVESDVHQAAIREAMGAIDCATFARLEVDRRDVPITWDRALAALAAEEAACG